MSNQDKAIFEKLRDVKAESPVLIEGLPGLGLVASIATTHIKNKLDLNQYGNIRCGSLPPVASFNNGKIRETIRVYSGTDPDIMTLQGDIPITSSSIKPLSNCILNDLSKEFSQAVFLTGTPAESKEEIGDIFWVVTDDKMEDKLSEKNFELVEGTGNVGGITGSLLLKCYRNNISSCCMVVKVNPFMPDLKAAISAIENGLEPLLEFDIDTSELEERSEEIKNKKQQIAKQLKQQDKKSMDTVSNSMYL